ncbi:MAG TPA: aspartate-semialdehyde dehydrogenase [Phycisphaerales bacterium]|nr:aspartate-semialdehyde dehydrogenase [Phycisphaerales bacterium]
MHSLTILKFGGSVLRSEEDLRRGVHEAYRWVRAGSKVVVVVSAFEGTTDKLLTQARSYTDATDDQACALLLATGEFTTASLLSLAFVRAGIPARVLGPQAIQLKTRGRGTDADPASIDRRIIDRTLAQVPVVIIPGFVGVDDDSQFTLLGRGGSDLTALFLAAELGASRCRLIKDVDGLYDRDPALPGPPARRFRTVSWETALTLDGGVIQHKAVLLARARGLSFEVGSFQRSDVSVVGSEPDVFFAPAPAPAPIRASILGAGTVGGGVYTLLHQLESDFEVTRVAVRDEAKAAAAGIPPSLVTSSLIKAASAPGDDVVIELIGGTDAAYHAVRSALSSGKHVVTANKALIAAHGRELRDLAGRTGGTLRYSAAVGGAVPLIESIVSLRRQGARIESIEGVINGTTNFVLDQVQSGASFDAAVKTAQDKGFAEADPTRDLSGADAAEKLAILSFHAFDASVRLEDIPRTGLSAQSIEELAQRKRDGQVIRLIASARRTPEGVVGTVEPRLVDARSPFAELPGSTNGLLVRTSDGAVTFIRGLGAGRWPTAQSVVADLLDLRRELRATRPAVDPTGAQPAVVTHTPAVQVETRGVRPARFAVVGATGAVGREVLQILSSRGIHQSRVVALASENSVGTTIPYGDGKVEIEALGENSFATSDLAIFAASADVARRFAPAAVAAGALVVDNSSAFRLDPHIPLIVPEINGSRLTRAATPPRLIANPNCSTVILLTAVDPLRRSFGVESIQVATYQAVSGAGIAAMDELRAQTRRVLDGHAPEPRFFKEPCAFNVFSHDSDVDPVSGLNVEERKIIDEARKIWSDPALQITPTCVRVPVLRAHTQAITVRLRRAATESEVRAAFENIPGVTLIDDRPANRFPTPLQASGRDDVLVGRLRPDPAVIETGKTVSGDTPYISWCLLACGDQLRKGAATNAIQIADLLAETV